MCVAQLDSGNHLLEIATLPNHQCRLAALLPEPGLVLLHRYAETSLHLNAGKLPEAQTVMSLFLTGETSCKLHITLLSVNYILRSRVNW